MLKALLAIFALSQPQPLVCERVDCIEVNHVYDCRDELGPAPKYEWGVKKRYRLSTVLFWDDAEIIDWRFFWKAGPPGPTRDGEWCVEWEDRGCIRRVVAPYYIETWTPYDVEVECRHRGRRRGLQPVPLAGVER